jgi:glyoxylase-like metal-dependent hydrolase (beta-lactamase superfamily II)
VTYLVERAGQRIAFTGDLIYGPGKVWSLASTQWTYTENEGPAMTVLSCYQLRERAPSMLLPSHGAPIEDPGPALDLLAARMQDYVNSRRPHPWDLRERLASPFRPLTEHLLHNVTSNACSYVLVSRTGAAMLFDYGYDMTTGLPSGTDRAARRPWLASLPALRRDHGVTSIEVVVPTHYHDDHVAGMNLLREVEGTEVWAPQNMAGILEQPMVHDLPCLWFDPIPVDRVLNMGRTFTWHEYEITVHDLPGHTLFAAAFEFVVDGITVMVTGDQQDGSGVPGERHEILNYQYRNRFAVEDYRKSAALYRKVDPKLMVSGHWAPRWVDEAYLSLLEDSGEELIRLHRDLLPAAPDLGADGILARITPYFSRIPTGTRATFRVDVRNPFPDEQTAVLRLVTPVGWLAPQDATRVRLSPSGRHEVELEATVRGPARKRSRVAVELSIGPLKLGQHAEAVVDVVDVLDAGGPA